eukprot:137417-Chlamydomonas_euryale.AAC.7
MHTDKQVVKSLLCLIAGQPQVCATCSSTEYGTTGSRPRAPAHIQAQCNAIMNHQPISFEPSIWTCDKAVLVFDACAIGFQPGTQIVSIRGTFATA